MDVPYVVAPYEADAQLAYLEKKGIIDGILTEDSDLLVFGCKRVRYTPCCYLVVLLLIDRYYCRFSTNWTKIRSSKKSIAPDFAKSGAKLFLAANSPTTNSDGCAFSRVATISLRFPTLD